MKKAFVYILECVDGSYYTGITTDFKRRFQEHQKRSPQSAKYTRSHPVTRVLAVWEAESYVAAARAEYAIKHLKKKEKEALIQAPLTLSLIMKAKGHSNTYTPADCPQLLNNDK